ncbi:MAG: YbaB/EbfC family nucleoid-associated protein [Clostridia bacterium]|jgi:DNA-binding YbaB/EbfC family protein|nr:MAG: Nucleoid-associated protein [Firmicutes bacterium ADurb.Bin146]HPB17201.1 YbaB/EbfC family nucleoid-associated protein [Clostridia bacterium]
MARGMMGGNMNYNNMLKQAQKMQADMAKAQEELEQSSFESKAGGGAVVVAMKGDYTMESITIDPMILEDSDVEMLQDMILTAVNESIEKITAKKEETLGKATGGMRMPF